MAAGIPIECFPVTVCSGTSMTSAQCCALPPLFIFFIFFLPPPNFRCTEWKCQITLHVNSSKCRSWVKFYAALNFIYSLFIHIYVIDIHRNPEILLIRIGWDILNWFLSNASEKYVTLLKESKMKGLGRGGQIIGGRKQSVVWKCHAFLSRFKRKICLYLLQPIYS